MADIEDRMTVFELIQWDERIAIKAEDEAKAIAAAKKPATQPKRRAMGTG